MENRYKQPLDKKAPRNHMALWLSRMEKPPEDWKSFLFYAVDTDTGQGLRGAGFLLSRHGRTVFGGYSNGSGAVWFPPLPAGEYQLTETRPPAGYTPAKKGFRLQVDVSGQIRISGVPVERFRMFHKIKF